MSIKTVFVDLDNTLYDYHSAHNEALKHILHVLNDRSECDTKFTEKDYKLARKAIHRQIPNTASMHNRCLYFVKLCRDHGLSLSLAYDLHLMYWGVYNSCMQVDPWVKGFFETMKDKYHSRIVVVTNFLLSYQLEKLKSLELLDIVDDVISSEECGVEKPHPNFLRYALDETNSQCATSIFIGDSRECDMAYSDRITSFLICSDLNGMMYTGGKFEFGTFESLVEYFTYLHYGICEYVGLCKLYGGMYDSVQAGGGNISVKSSDKQTIVIKASGSELCDTTMNDGFVVLQRDLVYDKYDIIFNSSLKPSMEMDFHIFIPSKYVIHLHPISINRRLCSKTDKSTFFGHHVVPYLMPGKKLGEYFRELRLKSEDFDCNDGMGKMYYLQNHGLIIASNNSIRYFPNSIDEMYKWCGKMSAFLFIQFGDTSVIAVSRDKELTASVLADKYCSLTPDDVVYIGHHIPKYKSNNIDELLSNLDIQIRCHNVFCVNERLFIRGNSYKKCKEIEDVLKAHYLIKEKIKVYDVKCLTFNEATEIIKSTDEKYRMSLK